VIFLFLSYGDPMVILWLSFGLILTGTRKYPVGGVTKTVQSYKIFLEYANFKQGKVYNPN
jgi:hypothetical protein